MSTSGPSAHNPSSGSNRDDVIRIKCPKLDCQRILAVPINARGKLVRCKNCGTNIRIPALAKASAPAPKLEAKAEKKEGDRHAA